MIFEAEVKEGKIINSKYYDKENILEFKDGNGYTRLFYDVLYSPFTFIKYEGELKNGIKTNKGKDYSIIGYLEFEGNYLNGKRNGRGKEYYAIGLLQFEGE